MSKFYIIKDLLSLSNFAKKYKVSLRKIYRYIGSEIIEHYLVDDVPYLCDQDISILKETHKRNELQNSVKTLTSKVISVKSLTQSSESVDNQDVNNVKILTETQLTILSTSDVKLNSENLEKKYNLVDLIEKIKRV